MKNQFKQKVISLMRISLLNSVLLALTTTLPTLAAPAVLSGSEPGSRINIRSAPSTTSFSPHYGIVGDRVETLRQSQGNDGYTWYYIRFNQSSAEGWVRGDFIRLLSKSSGKVTGGTYWVGSTDMVIEVKGQKYQYYDAGGRDSWKPISDLTYIREGVFFTRQAYWCLSTLLPRNQSGACTANGWRRSR